jgi:hypothetical protein
MGTIPQKTPLLDVNLTTLSSNGNSQTQTDIIVRAAQLSNNWRVTDENGDGSGYSSDSFHPLQKQDGYDDVALTLYGKGTISMLFSENYPPQSVSVQRWDAQYAGMDSFDEVSKGEPVNVSSNTFEVADDGNDYIYEVYAKWNEGGSIYVFSTNSYSPGLAVSGFPSQYTPAISSIPGMMLDISYGGEYTDVRYRAENGTFIIWSEGIISELGSDVTVKSDKTVYWSPDLDAPAESDTVTVTLLNETEPLAETVLPIMYYDGYWSAGEGTAPTPYTP